MSNYFVLHWPCGKCASGAFVDNPTGKHTAEHYKDIADVIREGQRVSYQRGGAVSIGPCKCSAQETREPPHDPWYGSLTGEALAHRAGFASVRDLLDGYKSLVRDRASR